MDLAGPLARSRAPLELQVGSSQLDRACVSLLCREYERWLRRGRVGDDDRVLFRFVTAGFFGALTQAFRLVEPSSAGTLGAMVVLPLIAHSLEFLVHWWRGTAEMATSVAISAAFTSLSTTFNLFAMRHGALIVGGERRPLLTDLQMPRLVVLFVATAIRGGLRAWR